MFSYKEITTKTSTEITSFASFTAFHVEDEHFCWQQRISRSLSMAWVSKIAVACGLSFVSDLFERCSVKLYPIDVLLLWLQISNYCTHGSTAQVLVTQLHPSNDL